MKNHYQPPITPRSILFERTLPQSLILSPVPGEAEEYLPTARIGRGSLRSDSPTMFSTNHRPGATPSSSVHVIPVQELLQCPLSSRGPVMSIMPSDVPG